MYELLPVLTIFSPIIRELLPKLDNPLPKIIELDDIFEEKLPIDMLFLDNPITELLPIDILSLPSLRA